MLRGGGQGLVWAYKETQLAGKAKGESGSKLQLLGIDPPREGQDADGSHRLAIQTNVSHICLINKGERGTHLASTHHVRARPPAEVMDLPYWPPTLEGQAAVV